MGDRKPMPAWVREQYAPVKRSPRPHIIITHTRDDVTTVHHEDSSAAVQDYVYTRLARLRPRNSGAAFVLRHLAYASGNPLHLLRSFEIDDHFFTFAVSMTIPDNCDCVVPPAPVPNWEVPLFEVQP